MHEYSCAPQQTVKTALLVKPNPHAHVGEKSALSGGGLDPSLRRWLPPVVVKEAKKGWRQRNTPAEMLFTSLANISWALCSSNNSGSVKSHHVW